MDKLMQEEGFKLERTQNFFEQLVQVRMDYEEWVASSVPDLNSVSNPTCLLILSGHVYRKHHAKEGGLEGVCSHTHNLFHSNKEATAQI